MDEVKLTIRFVGELPTTTSARLHSLSANALAQIEAEIANVSAEEAASHWTISDAEFIARASPNGVKLPALRQVAAKFRESFDALRRSAELKYVAWPIGVPAQAQKSLEDIGKQLADGRLLEIAVAVDEEPELSITEVFISEQFGEATHSEFSEVEGYFDTMKVGGRYEFRMIDRITLSAVTCSYTRDRFEEVKSHLKDRPTLICVEGLVYFRSNDTPYRIRDISSIRAVPQPSRKDAGEFMGIAPNLTGGLSAHDFVRRLRGDET